MRIKRFPRFQIAMFRSLLWLRYVLFARFVYAPRSRLFVCMVFASSDTSEEAMYVLSHRDFTLCHNTWVDCRELRDDSILHRVLTINVQDEWTEMCKRNVRDVMIVRHESENKKMKMKKDREERRHGKLEPERKIAHKKEKKHSKDEERRVTERGWWQRYFGNMPQNVRDECNVCSLPVLSTLLRRGWAISRVKCALRRGLRVPEVALRACLSLLSLSGSTGLCLSSGTLRESACASTVEPTRLRRGASTALRACRTASAHATNVLSTSPLGILFECRLL